jgi:putative nucleotidyltransferase with HDIG domain
LTPTNPGVRLAPKPPEHNLDPEHDLLDKALRSLGSLPPFSPILTRLLASLAEEDVSFAALGDLIEKDAVVAANILHLVNSALYARTGTISSVRHAISLLGTGKLRNAVLGMSIARVWNRVKMPPTWSMARFNMHSAAVALLSDLLAQRLPAVVYPEGAFVAGLLHDVGRLLLALGLPAEYSKIVEVYNAGGRTLVDCEREVVGFTHPELSAAALQSWKLPEEIQAAVRDHHSSPAESAQGIPLSNVLDAANQYANSVGVSILVVNHDAANPRAVELLGLDTDQLEVLLAEFRDENNAMAAYFH